MQNDVMLEEWAGRESQGDQDGHRVSNKLLKTFNYDVPHHTPVLKCTAVM